MRADAARPILACLLCLLVGGCSSSRMSPIGRPAIESPGNWWSADKRVDAPGLRAVERPAADAGPTDPLTGGAAARIEERIAELGPPDDADCPPVLPAADVEAGQPIPGPSAQTGIVDRPDPPSPEKLAGAMRERSAELFNARLRVTMIESRMKTAEGEARDALARRLDDAKAQLAYLEKCCYEDARRSGQYHRAVAPARESAGRTDATMPAAEGPDGG